MRMYYDNGRFYAGDISFTLPDKCSIDLDFDVVPNGLLLHSLEHDYFDLGIGISHYEDDYKHDFQEQIEESSRQATFSDFTINNLDGFSAQYTGMDGQSFEVVFPIRCAPLPELMDRKKRDIMERKGDKEDENKRQKQQKESSAAAL